MGTVADKTIQVDIRYGNTEQSLPLAEFKRQLIDAIGSVTWTVTRSQFERKVEVAIDKVIQRVRDEAQA